MGFFRRDIEVVLKALGVTMLVALIAIPFAWGYEKDRQARMWQSMVCTYRVNELARRASLTLQPEPAPDACTLLARLGFNLDPDEIAPPSFVPFRRVASRN
jgi:hypothetical protein